MNPHARAHTRVCVRVCLTADSLLAWLTHIHAHTRALRQTRTHTPARTGASMRVCACICESAMVCASAPTPGRPGPSVPRALHCTVPHTPNLLSSRFGRATPRVFPHSSVLHLFIYIFPITIIFRLFFSSKKLAFANHKKVRKCVKFQKPPDRNACILLRLFAILSKHIICVFYVQR